MKSHYDYIITGAGCAGLSLAIHLLQEPLLRSKSILLIDQAPKERNDRTWCFWEKDAGLFESIVHHEWKKIAFCSNTVDRTFHTSPYAYKMIRGIDFYQHCMKIISNAPNIDLAYQKVEEISSSTDGAFVQLSQQRITCGHLFNSVVFHPPQPTKGKFLLLQHFKGWVIKTKTSAFDTSIATLMDFRTRQEHGTSFFYVMPTAANEALVEYTLFTEQLLQPQQYTASLQQYINRQLNITDYEILHEEFGIIPMTNIPFSKNQHHITHIGTAGQRVKASSGYAFRSIQKQSAAIAGQLAGKPSLIKPAGKKFSFYDSVFLNVLHHHPQKGESVFSNIFRNNDHRTIFRFLDNESSLAEDLRIIGSLTSVPFIKAGWQEIWK